MKRVLWFALLTACRLCVTTCEECASEGNCSSGLQEVQNVQDLMQELGEDVDTTQPQGVHSDDVEDGGLEVQDYHEDEDDDNNNDGPKAPLKEQVEDIPWEEITGHLSLVSPENGTSIEGCAVAVQVNVNTNTANVTKFQEKFNHSSICISMDDSVYSCWPIVGLSKFPLYTNLTKGEHRIVAKLVDPVTGELLLEESVAESTFTMVPRNQTSEELEEDEDSDEESADEEQEGEEGKRKEKPKKETIAIPQVGVEFPADNSVVPGTFEVRLSVLTSSNLTEFRRLMQNSFICLSLDESVSQSCWPLFEENYYPKFFNIPPGQHTIQAFLAHPNTLELILGTQLAARHFWITDKKTGMIPMTLKDPSRGSNAFSEDLRRQVLEELSREEETRQQHAPKQQQTQERAQMDPEKLAFKSAERNHHKQQQQKKRSMGRERDELDPHVTLQINVDGVRHTLLVYKDEDYMGVAARFCMENNILGQKCVSSIYRLIEIEWQKYNEIPHLELFSATDV